jgi:hypothetical protein
MPIWDSGRWKYGKGALYFDNQDNEVAYVEVGDTSGLGLTSVGSQVAWIKPIQKGRFHYVLDQGNRFGDGNNSWLELVNWYGQVRSGTSTSSNVTTDEAIFEKTEGATWTGGGDEAEWTLVASTLGEDGIQRIYINGVLSKEGSVNMNPGDGALGQNWLKIGTAGNSTQYGFRGWIDEIQIYNAAISEL